MTHYKMLDRMPSVSITQDRNELKLYKGNTVYLNNGDNFELRFFNPTNFKIGVEIIFNGVKKGDSFLVLNPGQDVILDRFLDEQRKMLFETYVINGNNQEAVEAIQQNGEIKFNFYKENYYYSNNKTDIDINYNFPPKPQRYTKSLSRGITGNNGLSGSIGTTGTLNISTSNNVYYSSSISTTNLNIPYTNTSIYNSNSSTYTSPGVFTTEYDQSFVAMDSLEENELETGRIEKGEISNQTLKTVNANFSTIAFHSVSYKMLPYSAMDRTIGEVREYCTECRYRLRKQTWKFCPKCGTKIN